MHFFEKALTYDIAININGRAVPVELQWKAPAIYATSAGPIGVMATPGFVSNFEPRGLNSLRIEGVTSITPNQRGWIRQGTYVRGTGSNPRRPTPSRPAPTPASEFLKKIRAGKENG